MRTIILLVGLAFISCNTDIAISESEHKEFEEMARSYQVTYMEGSINLDAILAKMDTSIQMWENGKIWTYEDMVKFGPHLPKKEVIRTFNEQRLLEKDLGYDFSTSTIVITKGDTLRETTSRIWKSSEKEWKIVYMNNLISKEN